MTNLIHRLLRKNISTPRIIGFILSNFIGLAIVAGGLQFFLDASSIWEDEDSFIRSDYLVVNKRVTSANTLGNVSGRFSAAEIEDLNSQAWVRKTGAFTAANYKVKAAMNNNGRGMSTYMFFESIPDDFVDVKGADWNYEPGDKELPIIISKDYLTLYNFGFATSAGLPQLSESLMSGIPLDITLVGENGEQRIPMNGRIVGYSNRLNTILVPQSFMDWSNKMLAPDQITPPSRLIIDVNSPGDVAIADYMEAHDLEVAGDKSGSSASFLLKIVTGVVLGIGIVITLLSLFILLLSISLLMEKNREKLHTLLMLGYTPSEVGVTYRKIVIYASAAACLLAITGTFAMRAYYIGALQGLGADGSNIWAAPLAAVLLTLVTVIFNLVAVKRKVMSAWRN